MKKIIFVVFIILLLVIGIRLISREDTWLCDKNIGEWIKHGNPASETPKEKCERTLSFSKEEKDQIEKYIKENISTLSPEKEVLGGKFYITKFSWQNENSLIIEYEDGHIALRASVKPKISEEKITFDSFDILPN